MDWIPYVEIRDKETREIIGIIEGAELEFNYAFNGSGEFEVYCRATDNNLELLKKDNYVTLPVSINGTREEIETNSNMWVVQKIQKTNDVTGGRWISATGKEAKQIVDKRIIRNTAKLDKGADISSEVRTKLFTPNLLQPSDTRRPIKGFNFTVNTVGVNIAQETQVTYENLFEYTEELYKTYGVGARLRLDRNTNKMIYTIYKGNDRSNEIVFSRGNDNLLNSDYVEDWSVYKTSALVGGEEKEETDDNRKYKTRTMIVVEDGSEDINRSEVFIDAKDLQSSYNENVNGESVERTYTSAVYKAMLQARGKEKLASENNVVREFNGEIDPVNNNYKFNIDFYLGDKVKIRDEDLGEERIVQVSKFTKVQNDEGYKEYFEYEEISTLNYLEPEEVEGALLTEGEENLLTENNEVLLVEEVPMAYSTRSVSTTSAVGGVRISELPEATNINEDCCLPIVSEYETKRITYGGLKERLSNDLDISGETYDDTEIRNDIEEVRSSIPTKTSQLTNDSNYAAESYVDDKVANLVNSAPDTLDTLGELATAIQNNEGVVETLNAAITNKVDKVNGKGLSTNDYTNEDKSKLESLSNYDDTEVKALITAEETARKEADETLQGNIDDVSAVAQSASALSSSALGTAQNALDTATQARTMASSAQDTAIEAKSIATDKYTKPTSGIPKSDLASSVQGSLNKADTALQSIPSNYVTEDELGSYATEGYVDNKSTSTLSSAKVYANTQVNALREELYGTNANDVIDTITEIANALDENQDVVDALNEAVSKKANQSSLDTTNANVTALTTKVNNVEAKNTEQDTAISKKAEQSSLDTTNSNLSSLETFVYNIQDKNTEQDRNINSLNDGKVDKTTTVNGKALSENINLTASDVGALPDTTKYGRTIAVKDGEIILRDQNASIISTATFEGVKLYDTTGENTDGAMTQKAITTELNELSNGVVSNSNNVGDALIGSGWAMASMTSNYTVPALGAWAGFAVPFGKIETDSYWGSGRFTLSDSNKKITYNGGENIVVEIQFNYQHGMSTGAMPSYISAYVQKNGSTIARATSNYGTGRWESHLSASVITTLSQGDYIYSYGQYGDATTANQRLVGSNTNLLIREITLTNI